MTADKGWTLEYVQRKTFRQIACLWERYWQRKIFEHKMVMRSSPFYSPPKKSGTSEDGAVTLDLSGDNIDALIESDTLPVPIKRRPKPPET